MQYFNTEAVVSPQSSENSNEKDRRTNQGKTQPESDELLENLAVEEVVHIDMASVKKPHQPSKKLTLIPSEKESGASRFINGLNVMLWAIATLIAIGLYQSTQTIIQAWLVSPIIGGLLGFIFLGFIGILSLYIGREVQGYRRIQRIDQQRSQLNQLEGVVSREAWLDFYQQNQRVQTSPQAQTCHYQFFQKIKPHHQASDIQALYQDQVLNPLKHSARLAIKKDMMASAAISGLSPNALFQTLALVWLHLKMVRHVAQIYGFRPGMLGQIKLLKMAFNSMIVLSLTDVATDSLMTEVFGQGLLSKISAQSAEALVSARLTYRLGEGMIEALALKKKSTEGVGI